MKKLLVVFTLLFSTLLLASEAHTEEKKEEVKEVQGEEVSGFLTSKWCVNETYFKDCRLESALCGSGDCFEDKDWDVVSIYEKEEAPGLFNLWGLLSPKPKMSAEKTQLVLFVHNEGVYDIELTKDIKLGEMLKEGFGRNEVSIIGDVDKEKMHIVARGFKAPPPPKKSFFKGCL